jgi:hypothetical protein
VGFQWIQLQRLPSPSAGRTRQLTDLSSGDSLRASHKDGQVPKDLLPLLRSAANSVRRTRTRHAGSIGPISSFDRSSGPRDAITGNLGLDLGSGPAHHSKERVRVSSSFSMAKIALNKLHSGSIKTLVDVSFFYQASDSATPRKNPCWPQLCRADWCLVSRANMRRFHSISRIPYHQAGRRGRFDR